MLSGDTAGEREWSRKSEERRVKSGKRREEGEEESGQEGRYYRAGSSSRSQAAKTQFR